MKIRRHVIVGALLVLAAARVAPPARTTAVPESLTAEQFWALSTELSEPGGSFRSENLLSNERSMQHVIPVLTRTIPQGTAYLGVGPEQNYTYIAALKPSMAFIVDIRRGNLQLHLMYKALFGLSADRAEFVSRLFSRKRPEGLLPGASLAQILGAVVASEATDAAFAGNLDSIRAYLTKTLGLPLTEEDGQGLAAIVQSFYGDGPLIQYTANFGRSGSFPTYVELMTATDADGVARSYLASAESFAFVKDLHARNLIVPVVGDFAGPKALRAVARYLKDKQAVVGAFYLSNVEQYLGREGRWSLFCENAGALPLDDNSRFVRSIRNGGFGRGMDLTSVVGNMLPETRSCPG